MPSWREIWEIRILWNELGAWALAFLTIIVTFTVLPLAKSYISAKRRRWVQGHIGRPIAVELLALLVARTSRIFLWTVALYLASRQLIFPAPIARALEIAIVITFWLQAGLWGMAAVRFAVDRRVNRAGHPDVALAGSLQIIVFVAGLVVWTMAFLLALDNLGIEIKPLLAGLGIGGIAVALAVQTVLGDLLASMSIALDKPFMIGDFLVVDDIMGSVEHIGVKSTRLRSLSGEQIIMSNADILKSRVRNHGRKQEQRAVFQFGVAYDTPTEKLTLIPPIVREIIEAQPQTRFDRCHFLTYGEKGLQFETVYFITVPAFNVYADTQQRINLAILDRLRAMEIKFAFPAPAQAVRIELANSDADGELGSDASA